MQHFSVVKTTPEVLPGQRQAGMTLIEVLVTLLIFSLGLMGSASLQTVGLRFNQSAHLRTMAAVQAYDLADRMRANHAGIDSGDYDNIDSTPADPGCAQNHCSPAQLAQLDAHEWNSANASMLPAGTGTVSRNIGSDTFMIRIRWDDERVANIATNCGQNDDAELGGCFEMEFWP